MVMDNFIGFIASTFGIQFFMQYFGGKVLDKIPLISSKNEIDEKKWLEFYTKTLELLCKKMGWEFYAESVYRELGDEDFLLDNFNDEITTDRILCKLLGKDYEKYYGNDIRIRWIECIMQCITMPEFDIIYKFFSIEKINSLLNGQEKIFDEIKQIKITQKNIETEWKKREDELINKSNMAEFNSALEDIEDKDYESAIIKLKKVNIWANDNHTKFISYFKIGFCYSQLNTEDRYEKALKWYLRAEKISNYQRDDVVLLFRNIALTYISIGESESKGDNYSKSNEYFEKVIINSKEKDELYYYEALIHIARNYMDMCDEVPMNDVVNYLEISEIIMSFIGCSKCKLTAEMMYVLVHNMARLFYHKAEKIDHKYMETARELYEYVLTMDYVKQNKELLAMSNINAGMSYQYDIDNKLENLEKAIAFYEIGISLYESKGAVNYKYQIINAKLGIASVYKSRYQYYGKMEDFIKSVDMTNEIISKEKYNPGNSLLFRTYMLQLYLYIEALKHKEIPNEYIDLDKVRNKLSIMSYQVNYEKYKCTYQLLNCELDLLLINEEQYEKIESIKETILKIQKSTHEGNKNISKIAEEMLKEYAYIWDR